MLIKWDSKNKRKSISGKYNWQHTYTSVASCEGIFGFIIRIHIIIHIIIGNEQYDKIESYRHKILHSYDKTTKVRKLFDGFVRLRLTE